MPDSPTPDRFSGSTASNANGEANSEEGAGPVEEAVSYEPPQVEAIGQLPESTGMPASPQTFPDDPTR